MALSWIFYADQGTKRGGRDDPQPGGLHAPAPPSQKEPKPSHANELRITATASIHRITNRRPRPCRDSPN